MDKPLLHTSSAKTSFCHNLAFFLCVVFLACFYINGTFKKVRQHEVPVGVNLEWRELLRVFWEIGGLPKSMRHAQPYAGSERPQIPMSRCSGDGTQNCHHICLDRQRNPGISPPPRELPEPDHCLRILPTSAWTSSQCWDPSKMRCWNSVRGGNMIWDGVVEWRMLRHWQGDIEPHSEVAIKWLHARNEERGIDLIVFSWGVVRPIPDICDQFEILSGLPQRIQNIPPTQAVVIMGHSEGSGWAACTNKYMHDRNLPHTRRVVASAALLATEEFVDNMDEESRANSLFLLLGMDTKPGIAGTGGVIPDVFTIAPPPVGATFPQFGFSCGLTLSSGHYVCLDPQPQLDIGDGLRKAARLHGLLANFVLRDIHPFQSYKICARACEGYFEQIDYNFTPNIPTYVKGVSSSHPTNDPSQAGVSSQLFNTLSGSAPVQEAPGASSSSASLGIQTGLITQTQSSNLESRATQDSSSSDGRSKGKDKSTQYASPKH